MKIEPGSSNVYADLGLPDAQDMLIKAKLATEINKIIRVCALTQVEAAKILGMTQPKLSGMLRGQFRGISELKMIECLNRLGRDVDIVVKATSKTRREGCISVVFA